MGPQKILPVSVLITTVDRPDMLRNALRSVLAQKALPREILVWNDGGPDIQHSVLELSSPGVSYHRHPSNLGVVGAVAAALKSLSGEFVAQLDDDDEWEPTFLADLHAALSEYPTAALAFSDHWILDQTGERDPAASDANTRRWGRSDLRSGHHRPARQLMLDGCIPTASAALLRRSSIDILDFPPEVTRIQDRWIAYLATRDGAGAVYLPDRLAGKRRHSGQASGDLASVQDLQDQTFLLERVRADGPPEIDPRLLDDRLARALAYLAVARLREGRSEGAREAAARGVGLRRSFRGFAIRILTLLPSRLSGPFARRLSVQVARWRRRTGAHLLGGRTS